MSASDVRDANAVTVWDSAPHAQRAQEARRDQVRIALTGYALDKNPRYGIEYVVVGVASTKTPG